MQQVRIEAGTRSATGKGAARSLRREGRLPGVIYGHGEPATPIQIDTRAFRHALVNENAERALIDLVLDGESSIAVVKEIQQDPVRRGLLHVDFQSIRIDEEIVVTVEIVLDGEAPGVEEGGILEFINREVEVRVLPTNIPDAFVLDISEMQVGDSLHVDRLAIPEDVALLTDEETVIVSVAAPRAEEEVEEELEEGEEAMEPERIGEEDADEEDAADDE